MLRLFVQCNEKIFSLTAWRDKERAPAGPASALSIDEDSSKSNGQEPQGVALWLARQHELDRLPLLSKGLRRNLREKLAYPHPRFPP